MTTPLLDLFPGFTSHVVAHDGVDLHARVGGQGPPLVLLHGYPQTHVCWHRIAPALAETHTVVVMDLRGYGASSAPATPSGNTVHALYSKRTMATDVIAMMADLGHARFSVIGHDRGARVAYRLALDHPGRVDRLVVMDIVPTVEMWDNMRWQGAIKSYHWAFLAQPAPLPETLIAGAATTYIDHTLAAWTREKSLGVLDPTALAHYRQLFADPARIHAICEDYRAGASTDREIDAADKAAGRRITSPTLLLWGSDYLGKGAVNPLEVWQRWCETVSGQEIISGHFLAEENPVAVLDAVKPFLATPA